MRRIASDEQTAALHRVSNGRSEAQDSLVGDFAFGDRDGIGIRA